MTAAERDALGIRPRGRASLDAEVLFAQLEDHTVRQDRCPDRAASDGEVAEPTVQLLVSRDPVAGRVDLPHAAASGLTRPDGSVREYEPAGWRRKPMRYAPGSWVGAHDVAAVGQPERPVRVGRPTRVDPAGVSANLEPSHDFSGPSVDPDDLRSEVLEHPDRVASARHAAGQPGQLTYSGDSARREVDPNEALVCRGHPR